MDVIACEPKIKEKGKGGEEASCDVVLLRLRHAATCRERISSSGDASAWQHRQRQSGQQRLVEECVGKKRQKRKMETQKKKKTMRTESRLGFWS